MVPSTKIEKSERGMNSHTNVHSTRAVPLKHEWHLCNFFSEKWGIFEKERRRVKVVGLTFLLRLIDLTARTKELQFFFG